MTWPFPREWVELVDSKGHFNVYSISRARDSRYGTQEHFHRSDSWNQSRKVEGESIWAQKAGQKRGRRSERLWGSKPLATGRERLFRRRHRIPNLSSRNYGKLAQFNYFAKAFEGEEAKILVDEGCFLFVHLLLCDDSHVVLPLVRSGSTPFDNQQSRTTSLCGTITILFDE